MKQILQWLWYDRPSATLLVAIGRSACLRRPPAAPSPFSIPAPRPSEIEASGNRTALRRCHLKDLAAQNKLGEMREALPLQLKQLRHVRILLMDRLATSRCCAEAERGRAPQAPAGFQAGAAAPWTR
jgi:hypothetical protein